MPKPPERHCYSCVRCLPDDPKEVWWGESGQPYCSEDCMNDNDDAPEED